MVVLCLSYIDIEKFFTDDRIATKLTNHPSENYIRKEAPRFSDCLHLESSSLAFSRASVLNLYEELAHFGTFGGRPMTAVPLPEGE